MDTTRRQLLQWMAAMAAGRAGMLHAQNGPMHAMAGMSPSGITPAPIRTPVRPWLQPTKLARFVDPLPVPSHLQATERKASPIDPSEQIDYLRVEMRTAEVHVHRDLPPSRMWSYNGTVPGPTIEARSGRGLWIDWVNRLPTEHFLPIDHTLCGAGADLPKVRTAVHVHGAVVPPESDGFPEDWQTPGQTYRAVYPLKQDAATLWYHDHAMGIERLNQYAGLFGFFLIRDDQEDTLRLPSAEYEIPMVLCDRLFYADGQLHYPDSGDSHAPWIPEVFGDVVMVNGVVFPYVDVDPRSYRFRMLNASNTRFFQFSFSNQLQWTQVGSDQGLLPAPVQLKDLRLACAERADVILDFSGLAGERFTLVNQGQPVVEFRVKPRAVAVGAARKEASTQASTFFVPRTLRIIERIPESAAMQTRTLTLNEYMHPDTRLMLMLLNGKYWHDEVTEKPRLNSVEIWNLVNTTQDLHPIHLHLVRFQLLNRQPFAVDDYLDYGKFRLIGDPAPPEPGETGWKDTIAAHPETVTRIIIPFAGYPGRYVWHCHLLEHAANEMMRPFEVLRA